MAEFRKVTPGSSGMANPYGDDYTNDVNPAEWANDPRVLRDLRDLAIQKGKAGLSDEELVDWFRSSQRWASTNTMSAAGDYLDTQHAPDKVKAIESRLRRVWQASPNFWQEGGDGAVSALTDYTLGAVLDPVNLIPVGGSVERGGKAAMAAFAAGRTALDAAKVGAKEGIVRGALTEGGINAAQSGIVNVAQQGVEEDLGMRRGGLDKSELFTQMATDGLLGGVAGGLMGVPGAISGARRAASQGSDLVARGLTREDIARMPQSELNELSALPRTTRTTTLDRGEVVQTERPFSLSQFSLSAQDAFTAEQAAREAEAKAIAAEVAKSDDLTVKYQANQAAVDNAYQAYQSSLASMRRDGFHEAPEGSPQLIQYKAAEQDLNDIGALRQTVANMKAEAEQINALEKSNDPSAASTAAQRRTLFESKLADYKNAVLKYTTQEEADRAVADRMATIRSRAEADIKAEAEAKAAKVSGKPTEAAPAPRANEATPEAQLVRDAEKAGQPVTPEAAPAKAAEAAPAAKAAEAAPAAEPKPRPQITDRVRKYMDKHGVTDAELWAFIDTGASQTFKPDAPRLTQSTVSEVAKMKKSAGVQPPSAQPAVTAQTPAQSTVSTTEIPATQPAEAPAVTTPVKPRGEELLAGEDDYATRARQEVEDIVGTIAEDADYVDDADTHRQLFQILASDQKYQSKREDLEAIYDHFMAQISGDEKITSNMAEDPMNAKRAERQARVRDQRQGKVPQAIEVDNSMDRSGTPMTASEVKRAERIAKQLQKERGLDPITALVQAAEITLKNRKVQNTAAPSPDTPPDVARELQRNADRQTTGGKTERASIFTTAGRQMNGKKIAEFFKKGLTTKTIARDDVEEFWRPVDAEGQPKDYAERSVIGRGLEKGETPFLNASDFNRGSARELAIKNQQLIEKRKPLQQKAANARSSFNNLVYEELTNYAGKTRVEETEADYKARIARDVRAVSDAAKEQLELKRIEARDKAKAEVKDAAAQRLEISKTTEKLFDEIKRNVDPRFMKVKERIKKVTFEGETQSFTVKTAIPEQKAKVIAEKYGVSIQAVTMGIKAAKMELEAQKPVGPTIVPYITDGPERIWTSPSASGPTTVPAGTVVFYNAIDGKGYLSMDQAAYSNNALGGLTPADKKAALLSALANIKKSGNVQALRDVMRTISKGGDLGPKKMPNGLVSIDGTPLFVIAVRKEELAKGDNSFLPRKMSVNQARKGDDVYAIIGKSTIDEWEFRYTTDQGATTSPAALRKMWNSAVPVDKIEKITNVYGDARTPQAVPYEQYIQLQVPNLLPAEAEALSYVTRVTGNGTMTAENVSKLAASGRMTMKSLVMALDNLHMKAPLPDNVAAFDEYLVHVKALTALEARLAPNGYVLPNATREEATKAIEDLFSGYDSETKSAAVAVLRNLGGKKDVAPAIAGLSNDAVKGGVSGSMVFDRNSGKSQLLMANPAQLAMANRAGAGVGKQHPIATLLHEVGHWAYRNILTPQDRLELLNAVRANAYDAEGKLMADALKGRLPQVGNATENINEIIANQFSMWAMQNRVDANIERQSSWFKNIDRVWQKMKDVVVALFDRYYYRQAIMPEMEPIFSKILPDSELARFRSGRGTDPSEFGAKAKYATKINERYRELKNLRNAFEDELATGNDDALIRAAFDIRNWLRSATVNAQKSGTFGALLPLQKLLHMRIKDLTLALNGKEIPDDVLDAARAQIAPDAVTPEGYFDFDMTEDDEAGRWLASMSTYDPSRAIAIADTVRTLYRNGYEATASSAGLVPPYAEALIKSGEIDPAYSSLSKGLDMLQKMLEDEHLRVHGRVPALASPKSIGDMFRAATGDVPEKLTKRQLRKLQREQKAAIKNAVDGKLPDGVAGGEIPTTAGGVKTWDMATLAKEWQRVKGTERAKQIASQIKAKVRLEPPKAKDVEVPREIRMMGHDQLVGEMMDAINSGDPKLAARIDQIEAEISRRAKGRVERGKAAVLKSDMREAIDREIADSDGVETVEGVPPNTRAGIREMLSFLTHRDPEVNQAQRTLAYRVFNLMGKTVRAAIDDANVMSLDELSRLAGVNASPTATGATIDFRGEAFKSLRNDLRRITVGLVKGTSDAFDVIHELGHVVARGVLPDGDRAAIVDLYRAADDSVKRQVDAAYGSKYKSLPAAKRDERLAHEWFAESMTNYMAQRMARGDVFKAVSERNISDLKLRGRISTATDRFVEYMAYLTNGLIGRNDVKQMFRRLTIYGDLFESPNKLPLTNAFDDVYAIPSHLAADYVNESMLRNRNRLANMHTFVVGTAGEGPDGTPVVYYHASPAGYALRQTTSPDAIMRPSVNGDFGPGVYMTSNPEVATKAYGEKGMAQSLTSMIDDAPISAELKGHLTELVEGKLDATRRALSRNRAELAMLRTEQSKIGLDPDNPNAVIVNENIDDLEAKIADLAVAERAILDTLSRYGVKPDSVVLPLITNAKHLADFRTSMKYAPNDPFVLALQDRIAEYFPAHTRRGDYANATFSTMDSSMDGVELYKKALSSLGRAGLKPPAAKSAITEILRQMGYDGLRASYMNKIGDDAVVTRHDGVVVFEPGNLKHIDAEEFDAADERLYYSDVRGEPTSPGGALINTTAENTLDGFDDRLMSNMAEALEKRGVAPPLVDAMMGMYRKRAPDARSLQTLRRAFTNLLGTQSGRMRMSGMSWLADRVESYFPAVNTEIATHFYPMLDTLRALPGTDKVAGRWMKRSFGTLPFMGAKLAAPPRTYQRIVSAMRYGDGSIQERVLTPKEREAYKQLREMFTNLRTKLVDEGELIGNRTNYFPQVYNSEKVAANRADFEKAVAEYLMFDREANGGKLSPEDAAFMAKQIAATVTDDEADPFFPVNVQRSGSRADNLDYSRMFELEKYPGFMAKFEPFLEDDLEAVLVKYVDAASRRIKQAQTFGNGTHAYADYLKAVNEGVDGIADLLSTPKRFNREMRGTDANGNLTRGSYELEIGMPFEGRSDQAKVFATGLVELYRKSGIASARQALMDLVKDPDSAITFGRRAEAILGALEDFGGEKGRVKPEDVDHATETLKLVKRQPLTDAAFGGKMMLNASRRLRAFNAMTLLSFTTLTSIPDLTMPLIRSGEFKAWVQAMKNMAQDPDYSRLMRNIGVAIDSELHHHMSRLYGSGTSKHADAFFNATMLTPWTDMTRKIAAATGYETFKIMQDKAFKHYQPGAPIDRQNAQYKLATRFLTRYGLQDYLPGGSRGKQSLADRTLLAKDDNIRLATIKFTDEAVFATNPNDIPLWAQTPLGAIFFQLKSYPLLMGRLAKYTIQEASKGNRKPLLYLLTAAPAAGAVALSVKDIAQMRGGEEGDSAELRSRNALKLMGYDKKVHGDANDFLGWYAESFMTAGGFGLVGEMIQDIATQMDNGAYGKNRIYGTVFGPSVGTFSSAIDVGGGVSDAITGSTDSNSKERAAVRELVRRVPILGGIGAVREGITDSIAGERRERSTGGDGWSSNW